VVVQVALAGRLSRHVPFCSRSHVIFTIGMPGSKVEVDVKVTGAPAITVVGVHSKLAFGYPSATPTPTGDTTAPTINRQAVSRALT
jgi:hypothetical protein